jgi:hypothetical protein
MNDNEKREWHRWPGENPEQYKPVEAAYVDDDGRRQTVVCEYLRVSGRWEIVGEYLPHDVYAWREIELHEPPTFEPTEAEISEWLASEFMGWTLEENASYPKSSRWVDAAGLARQWVNQWKPFVKPHHWNTLLDELERRGGLWRLTSYYIDTSGHDTREYLAQVWPDQGDDTKNHIERSATRGEAVCRAIYNLFKREAGA